MEQEYDAKLHSFLAERDESVAWLESLVSPQWDNVYQHPRHGPMAAGLFLHSWLAHDYHHIRQINNLRYAYLKANSAYPLDYAGEW